MPLRHLHHNLLKPFIQTPSSPLTSVLDQPRSIQEQDYFDSIDKLRAWATANEVLESAPWDGVQMVVRSVEQVKQTSAPKRPKLLVCHDFKGGYTEDPFERGYSFEFWHLVDTFIYFSHNRVTIPPRGWLDAGRRHKSKVLGTVIFEWKESKPDLQKCLYGEILDCSDSAPLPPLPFSTTYASHLITLARSRKFDGYLLNVETDLNFLPPASSYPGKSKAERDEDATYLERESNLGGLTAFISSEVKSRRAQRMRTNSSALLGWVGWLRDEGKRRVGPHWEIIWYDSVTTEGHLHWQDALTPLNAPFFMNSDAIFTNYTWARPPDPSPPGAHPELIRPASERHPALLKSFSMAENLGRPTHEVYIGIDVFGRNCYGGFAIGVSLDMIFPSWNSKLSLDPLATSVEAERRDGLGFSVALFAPGWTWEREKEGGGIRTWEEWWQDELRFWFGINESEMAMPGREPARAAIGAFFAPRDCSSAYTSSALGLMSPSTVFQLDSVPLPPISRSSGNGDQTPSLKFYTNFNRGSGRSWWVRGRRVYESLSLANGFIGIQGWTDIGSCFPKPDKIWPRPTLLYARAGDQTYTNALRPFTDDQLVLATSLTDYDVWEGGTSLEIDIRNRVNPGHSTTANFFRTFLPLCTLYTCHLEPSVLYTLEVVVKRLAVSTGLPESLEDHGLNLRPCILCSNGALGGTETYRLLQLQSDSTEVRELGNGWYGIVIVARLDVPVSSEVPVFGLEIGWPLTASNNSSTTNANFKLIVGEISIVSLSQSSPVCDASTSVVVDAPASPQSPSNILLWKSAPSPDGAPADSLWGTLTWKSSEEDGNSKTAYHNVFFSQKLPGETGDADYEWLGTSTYELDRNSFVVAGLEPSTITAGDSHGTALRGDGPSAHTPRHIYFIVEQIGFMERLTSRKGARYTCKVEY